jgi:hypothetical protein
MAEQQHRATIDLSHLSDAERGKILKLLANPGRFEVLEVAQPAKPDSSLMGRVTAAIDNGTACDREPERIARDAIRAVTAWMREQRPYGVAFWAQLLEQEADR